VYVHYVAFGWFNKNKYIRLKTHVINNLKNSLPLFYKATSDGVEKSCKF